MVENRFCNKAMILNIPAKLPRNDLNGRGFVLWIGLVKVWISIQ